MNILLIGEYFSENLGDPLLCKVVQSTIAKEYPDATIIPFDMSGKVGLTEYYGKRNYNFSQKVFLKCSEKFEGIFYRNAVFRTYLGDQQRYIRTMCHLEEVISKKKFDLAVFAGGSLFMDYFAGIIYCIVRRLALKKIKVIFHACGMSELSAESTVMLKKVFNQRNVKSISLRDSYDKFCEIFEMYDKVSETYDTALSCRECFGASKEKVAEYGVGVINLPQFFEFQKQMIEYFIREQKSFKIITNGATYDYNFALEILNELGVSKEEQSKYIYERPRTAEELVYEITSFKYIVSFRMHSQIVAASFGIPSFGFVWDSKLKEFYEKMSLFNNYAIPDGKFDDRFKIESLDVNGNMLSHKACVEGNSSQKCLINSINSAVS